MLKQILTWPTGCNIKMDLSTGSQYSQDLERRMRIEIRSGLRQGRVGQDGPTKIGHQNVAVV
jgi:hypothetical protein